MKNWRCRRAARRNPGGEKSWYAIRRRGSLQLIDGWTENVAAVYPASGTEIPKMCSPGCQAVTAGSFYIVG